MKRIFLIVFGIAMVINASAQRVYGHGGAFYGRRSFPRVSIGIGYAPYAPYFGYGYPLYGFGYGYYPPAYRVRSSGLEMQMQEIRYDYRTRIWEARHDRSLSHRQRKMKVHELKRQREMDLMEARRNYYSRRTY